MASLKIKDVAKVLQNDDIVKIEVNENDEMEMTVEELIKKYGDLNLTGKYTATKKEGKFIVTLE